MIATGVASPNAHGQLIASTEMPLANAKPMLAPVSSQTTIVTSAITMTVGTNTPDTLSAILAIGAFVAAASLTIWMICDNVVSSPTRVARHFKKPDWLIVAADTGASFCLSTGTLSPVSADSSTALLPSSTMPSTGIVSPGLTTKISSFCTLAISTVTSAPSRTTTAVFGASLSKPLSASVVFPFERASNILPTVINVKIIAADSK